MLTTESHMTQQRIETEPAMAGNSTHNLKTILAAPTVNSTAHADEHVFSLVRRGICKNTQLTVSASAGLRERVVQRRFWDVVRDEATKDGPEALMSYLKENVHLLPSPKQLAASPESQRPMFRRRQLTTSKLSQVSVAPVPSPVAAACALVTAPHPLASAPFVSVAFPAFSAVRNRCGSALPSVRLSSSDSDDDEHCELVAKVAAGSGKRRRPAVMCA